MSWSGLNIRGVATPKYIFAAANMRRSHDADANLGESKGKWFNSKLKLDGITKKLLHANFTQKIDTHINTGAFYIGKKRKAEPIWLVNFGYICMYFPWQRRCNMKQSWLISCKSQWRMSAYLAVPVYTPLFSNNPLFSLWHYLLLNFLYIFFFICRGTCDSWFVLHSVCNLE